LEEAAGSAEPDQLEEASGPAEPDQLEEASGPAEPDQLEEASGPAEPDQLEEAAGSRSADQRKGRRAGGSKRYEPGQYRSLKKAVGELMQSLGLQPHTAHYQRIMERLGAMGGGDIRLVHSICSRLIRRQQPH